MAPSQRRAGVTAPKMFAFDAIFSQDESLAEMCATSLIEIIQAVVTGADGCLFCYGHARLGKTYTMIGVDDSPQNLGVIPCAIEWLFRHINEQKERTGARFSVRVSAVEVTGKQETLKDLLADVATGTESGSATAPGVYLREDPICGMQLENQSELRAPTAERAAYYLDAAVAARTVPEVEEDARNSHLIFTLHVYQYHLDKSTPTKGPAGAGVNGGRSRLHLLDLGSCSKSNKDGNALSLSALGNVVLALLNGQRHVPHRESKLTQLVRESLGNLSCRTCMIAHVSPSIHAYNETLQVIQLASRIHRMRRRKSKFSSTSSEDSSCDESSRLRGRMRVGVRMGTLREDAVYTSSSHSDPDCTSSEQSCDTVIYVGRNGRALSDRELTDNEGPPLMVPIPAKPLRAVMERTGSRSSSGEEGSASVPGQGAKPATPKCGAVMIGSMGLPPKSPAKTLVKSGGAGEGAGPSCVVQLPRKLKAKPTPIFNKKLDASITPMGTWPKVGAQDDPQFSSAAGAEQWIDGPNAALYNTGVSVANPGEHWVDGPAPPSQTVSGGAGNQEQWTYTPATQQTVPSGEEQWIDGPNHPTPQPVRPDNGELWVDGPTAFRAEATSESRGVPYRGKHKLSSNTHGHRDKCGHRDSSREHNRESSSKEQVRDAASKEHFSHKTRTMNSENIRTSTPLTNPVVASVGNSAERPISTVSQDSETSLAVNANSRPVSTHSEDPSPLDADEEAVDQHQQDLCEESRQDAQLPIKSFVKAWVERHSISSADGKEDSTKRSPRHHRGSPKHEHQHRHKPKPGHPDAKMALDDSIVFRKKTHSPDRLVVSAQSSPRLRRLPKNKQGAVPVPSLPGDRTAAWVHSVQKAATSKLLDSKLVNKEQSVCNGDVKQTVQGEPQHDALDAQDMSVDSGGAFVEPSSPPPDYESCMGHDSLCDTHRTEPSVQTEAQQCEVELPHNVHIDVEPCVPNNRTTSQQHADVQSEVDDHDHDHDKDPPSPPQCQSDKEADKTGSSCECLSTDAPKPDSTNLDITSLLMTNRESVYELQADEQLESVTPDDNHKMTYASEDGMSAWSSGSYQNVSDVKQEAAAESEHDEGVLDVDIPSLPLHKQLQLSPLAVQADNESGISSGNGHLSPPSSEESIGKKIGRPTCLRRPDGASNPNLTIEEVPVKAVTSSPDDVQKCVPSPVSDCSFNRTADGQSPDETTPEGSSDHSPSKSSGSSSSSGGGSKLLMKSPTRLSSIPGLKRPSLPPKPPAGPSTSPKKGPKSPEKPAVPPRTTSKVASSPNTETASTNSPSKSGSASPSKTSPSKTPSLFGKSTSSSKSTTKDSKNNKVSKVTPPSSVCSSSNHSFKTSAGNKSSSKSSKLPTFGSSSRGSNQSSPTKSNVSSGKDSKNSSRSSSKSPSPSKRVKDRDTKLPKVVSPGGKNRHTDSDSGNDSGIVKNETKLLSPYSKLTKPRVSTHSSSGHGSDASSSFSSQLPRKAGCKLSKVDVSSGYESMVRDSEITGTSSSNHDSTSESSSGGKSSKLIKKKAIVSGRRSRSAPARSMTESPASSRVQSPSSVSRKTLSPASPKAWVDTRRFAMGTDEPIEIKVYDFEDVARMTRRRREEAERAMEMRRERIQELLLHQERLKMEMMKAKSCLMIDKRTWSFDLHVAEHMDRDDQGYLEALEKETAILEKRVEACQSRIMMVTCFDVSV